jgi:hypothetical protein
VLQIIADRLEPDESQALPMAFQAGGLHHIYFCYRSAYDFRLNKDNINRLGYAYSDGLIHWHRDDSQSGIDLTESAMGWFICFTTATNLAGIISA